MRDYVVTWVYATSCRLYPTVLPRDNATWNAMIWPTIIILWLLLLPGQIALLGTTIGKWALGLRVLDTEGGRRPSFLRALAREVLMMPAFFMGVMWGVMALSVLHQLGPRWEVLALLGMMLAWFGVAVLIWSRCRHRRGYYPHDGLGRTTVVTTSGVRYARTIPILALACSALWWITYA